MRFWEAILLGFIQGITEFLPVSSSGHLAIAEMLTNSKAAEDFTFDVLLHLGTLVAIVVAFWSDVKAICVEFFKLIWLVIHRKRSLREPPARRMVTLLIIASLPLPLLVLVEKYTDALKTPLIIGFALLVTGLLLWLSDKADNGKKTELTTHWYDAIVIGLAQCIAAIPGLSRSGTTISTALLRRFNRQYAVRFSFLMAIPAIAGAALYKLVKLITVPPADPAMSLANIWPQCLIGMTVAAVVGYFAIGLIKKLMNSNKFGLFAYYCFIAGALVILGAVTGILSPT